ncbi:MAG: anti-sigma factor domain-containing protein [Verrucomicrobiales bacterium]
MADQCREDLAIDYALDLVSAGQRRELAGRIQDDDALREEVVCLEGVAADLTLLAPQVSPDPDLCAAIMDRIDAIEGTIEESPQRDAQSQPRSRLLSLGGWAVAACMAIAAVALALRNHQYREDLEAIREAHSNDPSRRVPVHNSSSGAYGGAVMAPEENLDRHGISNGRVADQKPRIPRGKKNANYRMQQDVEALRDRVADLKREREERFQTVPGLARLTVIEMVADPESTPSEPAPAENPKGGAGNSSVVEANINADGLTDRPEDPVVALNNIDQPPGVNAVSNALASGLVGLGLLDATIFPEFGLWDLRASSEVASDLRNSDTDTDPGGIPYNRTEATSAEDPDRPAAPLEPTRPMAAFTIYDETTGEGSILVQNLPTVDGGTQYQLWMVDSLETQPINVGALPELENGGGRIFFELGESGYSPSEFFLTQEAGTGSDVPTGEPILSGPRASNSSDPETIKPTE